MTQICHAGGTLSHRQTDLTGPCCTRLSASTVSHIAAALVVVRERVSDPAGWTQKDNDASLASAMQQPSSAEGPHVRPSEGRSACSRCCAPRSLSRRDPYRD